MSRLPTEEARKPFMAYLAVAQKAAVYNEEHPFYVEYYAQTGYHRVLREVGRRFVEGGAIDDPMDVFMLLPEEINRSLVTRAQQDLRSVVKRRRAWWHGRIEAEQRGELPPEVGALKPPDDAVLTKIVGVGITVEPVAGADLTGVAGSSGVAEGPARVILTVEELDQIQPGEILVAPYTSAAFTPVFGIIKGVVTDTGGTLAHAAVVARDHGIPSVVLTREATRRITTGQRIRVDGSKGAVYILK
jgi:pyruvate,water dikinase